jgi:hypothetical protein
MVSFAVCPSPTTDCRNAKSRPKIGSSIRSGPSTCRPAGVEVGVRRLDVGDDQLVALDRAGLHVAAHALAEDDRAGRPRGRDLHDPEVVAGPVIDVDREPQLVGVELLGAVDVGHRHDDHFELPVHDVLLHSRASAAHCSSVNGGTGSRRETHRSTDELATGRLREVRCR